MSYRKITVDGKQYEYSIGKTHTKIRHVGAWTNDKVGSRRWVGDSYTIQVHPKDVMWFIRSGIFRHVELNKHT